MHPPAPVSPWIARFAPLIAKGGSVLDLASGSGRHALWLVQRGLQVTAVDRDSAALAQLAERVRALGPTPRQDAREQPEPRPAIDTVLADLEDGSPWPLPGHTFDAVVITNYLHRPLVQQILASLAPGGVLLVETFADGNERLGRPQRPEFLLRDGELLQWAQQAPAELALQVLAYETGRLEDPARIVQRVALRRRRSTDEAAPPLPGPAAAP